MLTLGSLRRESTSEHDVYSLLGREERSRIQQHAMPSPISPHQCQVFAALITRGQPDEVRIRRWRLGCIDVTSPTRHPSCTCTIPHISPLFTAIKVSNLHAGRRDSSSLASDFLTSEPPTRTYYSLIPACIPTHRQSPSQPFYGQIDRPITNYNPPS